MTKAAGRLRWFYRWPAHHENLCANFTLSITEKSKCNSSEAAEWASCGWLEWDSWSECLQFVKNKCGQSNEMVSSDVNSVHELLGACSQWVERCSFKAYSFEVISLIQKLTNADDRMNFILPESIDNKTASHRVLGGKWTYPQQIRIFCLIAKLGQVSSPYYISWVNRLWRKSAENTNWFGEKRSWAECIQNG